MLPPPARTAWGYYEGIPILTPHPKKKGRKRGGRRRKKAQEDSHAMKIFPKNKATSTPSTKTTTFRSAGGVDITFESPTSASRTWRRGWADDNAIHESLIFAHNAIRREPTVVVPTPKPARDDDKPLDWPTAFQEDDEDDDLTVVVG